MVRGNVLDLPTGPLVRVRTLQNSTERQQHQRQEQQRHGEKEPKRGQEPEEGVGAGVRAGVLSRVDRDPFEVENTAAAAKKVGK